MGKTAPGAAITSTSHLYAAAAKTAPRSSGEAARQTKGIDIASYQGPNVNFSSWRAKGVRFAYIKATEGGTPSNKYGAAQVRGARAAGLYVGRYDYANPVKTAGAGSRAAANFVRNGGGWKAGTKTLPGTLDLETSVDGRGTCYGLSKAQSIRYISDWTRTYKRLTGKDAVIFANPVYWKTCTGNTSKFNKTNPLWVSHWGAKTPERIGGQNRYSLWQYAGGTSGVDLDYFNGSERRLALFANRSW